MPRVLTLRKQMGVRLGGKQLVNMGHDDMNDNTQLAN